MGEDKTYQSREIHCGMCDRYLGTLKIKVNPDRLAYEDDGKSRDITLAELENMKCPKCGKKTDLTIVMGRKAEE